VKRYLPIVTKAIAVYDAASNCLTLAYKENINNYYILTYCSHIGYLYFFQISLHLCCVSFSNATK